MLRRFLSSIALVLCATTFMLAADERATFILTDGERKSGTVVFHGDQHENLFRGYLNLGVDGARDMTFPIEQVAVIDFVGGRPPASELAQLGTAHMLVTRDGATQAGRFVNMIGGTTLLWDNEAGQRQQFGIRDVSRVYLNPQSARTAYRYRPAAAGAATTAAAIPGPGQPARFTTVRVDAQQTWTDTGVTVVKGDLVTFQASGQVQIGPAQGQTATPDGSTSVPRRRPLPRPKRCRGGADWTNRQRRAVWNRDADAAVADAGRRPPHARSQRRQHERQRRVLHRGRVRREMSSR